MAFMRPDLVQHLRENWPLALIAIGLCVYLPIVLIGGVFFTNQGRITRAGDPVRYWRWVRLFLTLFVLCAVVLAGTYLLRLERGGSTGNRSPSSAEGRVARGSDIGRRRDGDGTPVRDSAYLAAMWSSLTPNWAASLGKRATYARISTG